MHYRNGREAKNGDEIVQLDANNKVIASGVLYGAVPGSDYCNGNMAPTQNTVTTACLRDCVHVDDVTEMINASGLLDGKPDS